MAEAQQGHRYLRTKPVEQILSESQESEKGLKRVLSAVDLTAIGVGAIIGAGIFVLTGTAARDAAGPAIMLSYVFAGISCILAAFCYAEFASRLPISGSAYTYAYASVGEIVAWIIGWDLILEYTIGASTVAVGWTHYLESFLAGYNITLPPELLHYPLGITHANLLAGIVIMLLGVLLCIGVKESARFNAVMVSIKLLVVLFVIFAGIPWVKPEHWQPFFPFGVQGVFSGAALIFFAYIGFDAVSTAAEEVKNPKRDLPLGIIASLVICTVLYVSVAAVITGMVPYHQIDAGAPLAAAFGNVGNTLAQKLIGLGGVVGLLTVMLILLLSQPRIYYSMARDQLLGAWFGKVHPKFRTPINATLITCLIAATMAMVVPMEDLHHMVSIGTLFAFVVVSGSVLISRYKTSDNQARLTAHVIWLTLGLILGCFALANSLETPIELFKEIPAWHQSWVIEDTLRMPLRLGIGLAGIVMTRLHFIPFLKSQANNMTAGFSCPGVPWVPLIAMSANIYMMVNLNVEAWIRLFIWLALGMVIYAFYGSKHSKLN